MCYAAKPHTEIFSSVKDTPKQQKSVSFDYSQQQIYLSKTTRKKAILLKFSQYEEHYNRGELKTFLNM